MKNEKVKNQRATKDRDAAMFPNPDIDARPTFSFCIFHFAF